MNGRTNLVNVITLVLKVLKSLTEQRLFSTQSSASKEADNHEVEQLLIDAQKVEKTIMSIKHNPTLSVGRRFIELFKTKWQARTNPEWVDFHVKHLETVLNKQIKTTYKQTI